MTSTTNATDFSNFYYIELVIWHYHITTIIYHTTSLFIIVVIKITSILSLLSVAGTEVNWPESAILLHSTGWQPVTGFGCQTHSQFHSAAQRKSNSYHQDSTHKTIQALNIRIWKLSTQTTQAVDELNKISENTKHNLSPAFMHSTGNFLLNWIKQNVGNLTEEWSVHYMHVNVQNTPNIKNIAS